MQKCIPDMPLAVEAQLARPAMIEACLDDGSY